MIGEDDTIDDEIDNMIEEQGSVSEELAKVGLKPKLAACGNPKCCTSTGIHEGLTFGHGRLDQYGFWEHPCHICARDWDARRGKEIDYFRELYKNHKDAALDMDKFLYEQHPWLFIEGWPFREVSAKEST